MGSKGSNTSNTSQSQQYTPTGAGYITNALNTAQNAAQLPFNLPQAPVAGFGALQNQGFGQIGQSANLANPYFQQAGNLYGQASQQPNVNAFFNPMTSAVTAQLNNIFGQQNSQNTGQLTQAAGGVGADRIAVGQANLANQQGLAAGQTYAGLYSQAQQAAQAQQQAQMQAASGLANTGAGMQNAALSGGNALLGAGGLQQNLAQQQLNAPYQQQLAQAMFPYQQSQFLSGAVGALAPGLGGTTTGQGQTTSQYNPSLWGQIGGGLSALGGIGGYLGGSGKGSSPSYGGGNMFSGDAYGGSGSNPLPGLSASDYGVGYAPGGAVSDAPIDVSTAGKIPVGQIPHIAAQIPHLNLTPPAASGGGGGGSGGGMGDLIKTGLSIASMFGRGGTVYANPFADGGEVDDATRAAGLDKLRQAFAGQDSINPDNPFRMPDQAAVSDWRNATPLPASATKPPAAADDEAPDTTEGLKATSGVAAPNLPRPGTIGAAPQDTGPSLSGFLQSPWAALTAGGLDAMRTGSLASGFGTTMKLASGQREAGQKDETIQQAADRLQQEAAQHVQDFGLKQQTLDLKRQEQEGTAAEKADTVKSIADAIVSGDQPPSTSQLYGKAAAVKAELAKRHFNLEQAQLQDLGARRQVATLNSPQITKLIGLSQSVDNTAGRVRELAQQMHNSGIPIINRAKLAALMQTEGNSPRGQLATQYLTAVNTLKEEFANAATGGYAPTDAAWHLANQQISGDYGEQQLDASLSEIQRLIRYRVNAIPNINTLGPGAANRYTGQTGQQPAAQGAAPSKPPVVYQNGHAYNLQPDGSYQ
jgi:hypothetical protein